MDIISWVVAGQRLGNTGPAVRDALAVINLGCTHIFYRVESRRAKQTPGNAVRRETDRTLGKLCRVLDFVTVVGVSGKQTTLFFQPAISPSLAASATASGHGRLLLSGAELAVAVLVETLRHLSLAIAVGPRLPGSWFACSGPAAASRHGRLLLGSAELAVAILVKLLHHLRLAIAASSLGGGRAVAEQAKPTNSVTHIMANACFLMVEPLDFPEGGQGAGPRGGPLPGTSYPLTP